MCRLQIKHEDLFIYNDGTVGLKKKYNLQPEVGYHN